MSGSPELHAARVRVPASTSNLGAGFDCIGLAVDRYLLATYEPGADPLLLERRGTLAALDVESGDDLVVRRFRARLAVAGIKQPRGMLRVRSDIPIARGLGSSAAASLAGLALANAVQDADQPARADTVERVAEWEGHADNAAAAILGGLTAVTDAGDGKHLPFRLPLSRRLGFAFAAPGSDVPTPLARRILPRSIPHAKGARVLGHLAALVQGLAAGDPQLLRAGFRGELHAPYRLTLVPRAGAAIQAARDAGAYAATLSGSGSGVVAVCDREAAANIAESMVTVFRTSVSDGDAVAFPLRPDFRGVVIARAAERVRA